MNIIFLDIDGVLNSNAYFEQNKGKSRIEISNYHLKMLAKIYHTCNANIVLSSSWRELDDESDIHTYWMYEYLVNEETTYKVIGDILFYALPQDKLAEDAPSYIIKKLTYKPNGAAYGDIMEEKTIKSTSTIHRIKQTLDLTDKT